MDPVDSLGGPGQKGRPFFTAVEPASEKSAYGIL